MVRKALVVGVFSVAAFLSAFLLFWLQLLYARLVLPLLGGAPAVWITCLTFFQAVLLAGYALPAVAARVSQRAAWVLHAVILAAGFSKLPIGLPAGPPSGAAPPVLWLLLASLGSVGLPALAVSTSAPLLQQWLSRLSRWPRLDPYTLYAASNLGSLGALVAFPTVLEGRMDLRTQSLAWGVAYAGLALLLALLGALPRRRDVDPGGVAPSGLDAALFAAWTLLAAVPASLLSGVTMLLTTDVASMPLLWALPLALYLATWVAAFAPALRLLPYGWLGRARPALCLVLALAGLFASVVALRGAPAWLALGAHLCGFFAVAASIHRGLAELRPEPRHLPAFYVAIALGGLLGGSFNALVAPLAFRGVLEYPLMLVLAALLPQPGGEAPDRPGPLALLGAGLAAGALLVGARPGQLADNAAGVILVLALVTLVGRVFDLPRPAMWAAAVLVVLMAAFAVGPAAGVLRAERSFFGVHRVVREPGSPGFHALMHGTTLHGRQSQDPARRREPLTYFHPTGPLGRAVTALQDHRPPHRVAVLGLGVGTLAAYARPGQSWDFYEIDPVVESIARDPRFFTYLADAPVQVRVVPGDARLSLASGTTAPYDLFVLDAFTSDAMPVHLFTREAFALYLSHLADDGILLVNVSNRFLHLEPVLAAIAADLRLAGLARSEETLTPEERRAGKTPSHWVALARQPASLAGLADAGWRPLAVLPEVQAWTDQRSSLLGALR